MMGFLGGGILRDALRLRLMSFTGPASSLEPSSEELGIRELLSFRLISVNELLLVGLFKELLRFVSDNEDDRICTSDSPLMFSRSLRENE